MGPRKRPPSAVGPAPVSQSSVHVTKEMRSFKTPSSMARDKNTEHTTARHELMDESGPLTFVRRSMTSVRFSHRPPSQNFCPVLQTIISS